MAYRLYLPQDWAQDRERRSKTGVPEVIGFMTKPQIVLEQLHFACEAGLPRSVALMEPCHQGELSSERSRIAHYARGHAGARHRWWWHPGSSCPDLFVCRPRKASVRQLVGVNNSKCPMLGRADR